MVSEMNSAAVQRVATKQCVYCGKPVNVHATQCPFCREAIPEVHLAPHLGRDGRKEIRRGLLYMLMAAVIHFFVGGYSAMNVNFTVSPLVTTYLSPLLFLGGFGLMAYGVFLKIRS